MSRESVDRREAPRHLFSERLPALAVSRETFERLEAYADLVQRWQQRINLVATATLDDIWSRHLLDSAQIYALGQQALRWVDIGSGGGFPGIVIGIFLAEKAGGHIHLVESNHKKASFLRHAASELGLPVSVQADRIERVVPALPACEVVTARALASLDQLLVLTNLLLKRGAIGLFPKGRGFEGELTEAAKSWHFSSKAHPSVTGADARILEITM